jgi:hypothetical protein
MRDCRPIRFPAFQAQSLYTVLASSLRSSAAQSPWGFGSCRSHVCAPHGEVIVSRQRIPTGWSVFGLKEKETSWVWQGGVAFEVLELSQVSARLSKLSSHGGSTPISHPCTARCRDSLDDYKHKSRRPYRTPAGSLVRHQYQRQRQHQVERSIFVTSCQDRRRTDASLYSPPVYLLYTAKSPTACSKAR